MKQPVTYIINNPHKNVLSIGVTSDLSKTIWEHEENLVEGFSKKYHLHKLVFFNNIIVPNEIPAFAGMTEFLFRVSEYS